MRIAMNTNNLPDVLVLYFSLARKANVDLYDLILLLVGLRRLLMRDARLLVLEHCLVHLVDELWLNMHSV